MTLLLCIKYSTIRIYLEETRKRTSYLFVSGWLEIILVQEQQALRLFADFHESNSLMDRWPLVLETRRDKYRRLRHYKKQCFFLIDRSACAMETEEMHNWCYASCFDMHETSLISASEQSSWFLPVLVY